MTKFSAVGIDTETPESAPCLVVSTSAFRRILAAFVPTFRFPAPHGRFNSLSRLASKEVASA